MWSFVVKFGVGENDNPLLSKLISVLVRVTELRLCIVR